MGRKGHTVSHTAEELEVMRQRGESRSDWAKAAAMTSEEIEASVASDPDEANMVMDWEGATLEMPQPKAALKSDVSPVGHAASGIFRGRDQKPK
jgi:hypothetical protein